MSELNKEYKRIMSEIDGIISDENEKINTKKKIEELSTLFIDKIEYLNNIIDDRLDQIEQNEARIENKLNSLERTIDEIEDDIYEEDDEEDDEEDFKFEVICPYCNSEFDVNLDEIDQNIAEIRCPKCNNIIELDFSDEDDFCQGNCHGCHGCSDNDDEDM